MALSIVDALLPDGSVATVRTEAGLVRSVGAPAEPGDDLLHAEGRLLLPAMAEAHAHLDKAFLAETVPNPTGDLMGAIVAMETHRHLLTRDDTAARAERAARLILANGATAIRTHADVTTENGLTSAEALLDVRDRLRGLVDIQVFALCGWPCTDDDQRRLVREAVTLGIDGVGGCPHLEDDPEHATDFLLELAGEAALPLDLHTDETLDPTRFALPYLARRVLDTGFEHGVTASHCVSLGMQPADVQARTAEMVAAAGISVVALPSSNLYLQGREHQEAMPRALTAVRALREAGVNVAAGADNLQDPFNLVGRGDCLETAALMVMAGHQLPDDAYHSVSSAARRALGLQVAGLSPGDVADLVLLPAVSVREAVAFGPTGRVVLRNGVVVAGT
ncbi:MAG: putative cytosine deaminase [Actinomycetota bacterium]|jgi:cytosine deaminase